MPKLSFLVSLTTDDNDYQLQQAAAAEQVANRLGIDLQIIFAENDAINQSQQILKAIQTSGKRPNGIVFEPAGTGLAQVAQTAAAASIGWCVLNREVDYLTSLRKKYGSPTFAVSSDHEEVGRIEGRQMKALLPTGGLALYIEGPAWGSAAQQRTKGMYETKPSDVQVRVVKGKWTDESGYSAISNWLRLSTSHDVEVGAIIAQNDAMAMGARRAFKELTNAAERESWLRLPFTGCDGLPRTGAAWVDSGELAATIVVPPNAGTALEMMVKAIKSSAQPPEVSFTQPMSYPAIEKLRPKAMGMARG